MVMRSDISTSAPQGSAMKKKAPAAPAAPVPHHVALGQTAVQGMMAAPSHQMIMPQEQFFQAQQDYSSGIVYRGQPNPAVRPVKR